MVSDLLLPISEASESSGTHSLNRHLPVLESNEGSYFHDANNSSDEEFMPDNF